MYATIKMDMNSKKFLENVKSDILYRLEQMEGETEYLCDIGFKLTETENCNGSWYCSSYKATEEVKSNFDIFGKAAEYMRDNWCDTTNPFLETELFHVKAMICIYENTFNAAVSSFDEWNDEIEINEEFVQRVKEAFEDVYNIF